MKSPDLSLLVALQVLLETQSVAESARRLELSPSAMSRTLSRLRETTGDPLLVRLGRGFVPTPRAEDIMTRIAPLVQDATALLNPQEVGDVHTLERIFVLSTADGFVENFGPQLNAKIRQTAPKVVLHFVQKTETGARCLQDGGIDLETGVIGGNTPPDLRTRSLFNDRFIATVREGHPLCQGNLTPDRFTAFDHVEVHKHLPKGVRHAGTIDDRLNELGLQRNIVMVVGGFATALSMARQSDLVATVPEQHTNNLRAGLVALELPFEPVSVTISMLWHPRMDADPAHQWLRGQVCALCSA
ncbi:LysR family transcriptional regulator [Martelella soudanensis]|uniref:LysR family transcriptional regulator n=1 Tax=unclassified Martelella TaxID=2629616 RepID=UPI0015DF5305|nr:MULTISPECIES: LysR family transcriptional regulator [unclassified Martelella]